MEAPRFKDVPVPPRLDSAGEGLGASAPHNSRLEPTLAPRGSRGSTARSFCGPTAMMTRAEPPKSTCPGRRAGATMRRCLFVDSPYQSQHVLLPLG